MNKHLYGCSSRRCSKNVVLHLSVAECLLSGKHVGAGRCYECPLCDAVVGELQLMRAHLEEHYPRDSPTCPVASCAKAFSHPNSVRNHMRMKHAEQWDKMKTLKWSYIDCALQRAYSSAGAEHIGAVQQKHHCAMRYY
ncbi:hypothetical protein PR048_023332 [Dryococelus australis]|uniref:C2H2-type domain-containing protein n=1 Tax=Dryococelus australis TaxID=614101 RepID=A0ABQ9GTT1_9NEOP|nr:hypothetical protein PR048_023332 [Dryococelus australis]